MTAPQPTPQDELRAREWMQLSFPGAKIFDNRVMSLANQFALVRAEEREACAKIADLNWPFDPLDLRNTKDYAEGWDAASEAIETAIRTSREK